MDLVINLGNRSIVEPVVPSACATAEPEHESQPEHGSQPEETRPSFTTNMQFGDYFGKWVKRSIMGDADEYGSMSPFQVQPLRHIPAINDVSHCNTQYVKDVDNIWLNVAEATRAINTTCAYHSVPCACAEDNLTPLPKYGTGNSEQDNWLNELLDIEAEQQRLCSRPGTGQSYQNVVPDASLENPINLMAFNTEESSIYYDPVPEPAKPHHTGDTAVYAPHEMVVKIPKVVPVAKKASRPRLCNFLLELLADPQQYSDVVEWLDKEKGVFKFVNSAAVALKWGQRRNKPQMKYENFARSLRTYIAKGILTKPRSKLVYRFVNKVR